MELNGPWFIEPKTKNTILFKGINLGAGTKLPVGLTSHDRKRYWKENDRYVSFVGRPFPLNEADNHLQRLLDYGFNLLRFVITWEAIEHEGPGIYDEDYLNYVVKLLKKCKQYNFRVFIDPHQDCWSRHCGGSGHPGWTLLLAGLNPIHFGETEAALVHNLSDDPKNFPKMIWPTNYQKLATATLFTLFFSGKTFAPKCIVNGVHIQDYLQDHYFNSIKQLALRIHESGDLEDSVVLGYDSMNEPGKGYLPFKDLDKLLDFETDLKMGKMPTPFQGMLLASGFPTKVAQYEFKWNGPKKTGEVYVDPEGKSAWLSLDERVTIDSTFGWERDSGWSPGCIWETHRVWDRSSKELLLPHYFQAPKKDFIEFWLNHLKKYVQIIRSVHKQAILFVQPPVLEVPPDMPSDFDRLVYSPHWYDGITLVKKKWSNYNIDFIGLQRGKYGTGPLRFLRAIKVGEKSIRECFVDELHTIQKEGSTYIGDYPCVMGEIGIPYDMNQGKSASSSSLLFSLWSGFLSLFSSTKAKDKPEINSPASSQNRALDANFNALEKNLLNYTLWQYMPDNNEQWGDLWNGEDLSIWQSNEGSNSLLKSNSISSTETLVTPVNNKLPENDAFKYLHQDNVRDLVCLYRPHPHITSGTPLSIDFISPTEKQIAIFKYTIDASDKYTEIHIPNRFFPLPDEGKTKVTVNKGEWKVKEVFNKYWVLQWKVNDKDDTRAELKLEGINFYNANDFK